MTVSSAFDSELLLLFFFFFFKNKRPCLRNCFRNYLQSFESSLVWVLGPWDCPAAEALRCLPFPSHTEVEPWIEMLWREVLTGDALPGSSRPSALSRPGDRLEGGLLTSQSASGRPGRKVARRAS